MKKLYVIVSMLCFAGGVFAQQKSSTFINPESLPSKAQNIDVKVAHENNVGATVNRSPEAVVFTEDFANGYDGNNELGQPWTFGGDQGTVWEISTEGPIGQFSANTGPLGSETAANGFALIDADLFNADLDNLVQVNGWIESPTLDLTDLGSVLVDFTTYYRYCCFGAIPVFISASNDGGVNWTNFKPYNYGQFIEGANNGSGTLNVTADISTVAANQSNVKIRFAYMASEAAFGSSFTHYYYGVDDVVVYENPNANNLSILQVMNGDVDLLWELKNTPVEQTSELVLGAVYGNYGSATQTGVTVTWDIMLGDDIINTTSVDLGDVSTTRLDADGSVVQNIDTAWVNSGFTLSDIGKYTIRTTIAANEEEEVPETNIMNKNIEVTIDVMSHDDLDLLDIQLGPRDAEAGSGSLFDEVGFGTRFFVFNPGSMAYGLQVVFGDSTTPGTEAFFEFYEVNPEQGINATADNMPADFPIAEAEYVVTEADFGVPVFVKFFDAVELEVGKTYLASVRQFEGDEEVWVRGTANTDTDNSSFVRERSGGGDMFWFSRATELAVRLGFSETVTVNEIAKQELNLAIAPNPANNYTIISYKIKESNAVDYKMYDVNGRLITSENLGTQGAGAQSININTSSYETGVYYLIITVGESTVSEKIVITK